MPVASNQQPIPSFEEARLAVEEHARQVRVPEIEVVDLMAAAGRILADPILADRDFPPFPRSTRDGYAVGSSDLRNLPAMLEVIGEIKAGEKLERIPSRINSGQAVSIMTGAPVPAGADTVVMVEHTSIPGNRGPGNRSRGNRSRGNQVEIAKSASAGENIVPRGAEAKQGSVLLHRGVRLNEAAIAVAASVGRERLDVYRRPSVAVLATGDEIVDIHVAPGPTEIRNSNTYSLAAQVRQSGGEPIVLPVAADERHKLRKLIEEGLRSDLLLMTGGVSMGRYDLVEQILSEMHAEFFFTGAKIQPGRPVVFGRCRSGAEESPATYFFGLPGNPVSTMVTFELFARPMQEALTGQIPTKLVFLHARLKGEIRVKTGLRRFLPAILSGELENSAVELVAWQGSGDIAATARANCYVVVPADREQISAGEWVAVMMR